MAARSHRSSSLSGSSESPDFISIAYHSQGQRHCCYRKVAEQYLEVEPVQDHDGEDHERGGERWPEDTPSGEYPEGYHDLNDAEGVQQDEVGHVTLEKGRKVADPRVRVVERAYGRIEKGEGHSDTKYQSGQRVAHGH